MPRFPRPVGDFSGWCGRRALDGGDCSCHKTICSRPHRFQAVNVIMEPIATSGVSQGHSVSTESDFADFVKRAFEGRYVAIGRSI